MWSSYRQGILLLIGCINKSVIYTLRLYGLCLHRLVVYKQTQWCTIWKFMIIAMMSHDRHGISNHQHFNCLLNIWFGLIRIKTSKLYITGPLWVESTGQQWIPLTKGQQCIRHSHTMIPSWGFNTLKLRQNCHHFAHDIFKYIFFNENVWIPIEISRKFVPKGPINNITALI